MLRLHTGGLLNKINEAHKCNDPRKTIRISALMRVHNPRTEQDMLALLNNHKNAVCSLCGEQSRNGGIEGWQAALWAVVQQYSADAGITAEHCNTFVYDLYVRAPVRGFIFEDLASQWLKNHGYHDIRMATPAEDCEYAVDIIVQNGGATQLGIQVKPISYKFARSDVHDMNLAKNKASGYPVLYLYYNSDGLWDNEYETLQQLYTLMPAAPRLF
jgi:hypothetical protein